MNSKMMKFLGVLVMCCCYLEFVKGSCLSYGHSCWGAHGKRGNLPPRMMQPQTEQQLAERWALIKMMPPQKHYNMPEMFNNEEKIELNRLRKIGGKSIEQLMETNNSEEANGQQNISENKNFGSRQMHQLKKQQILSNPGDVDDLDSENLEDELNAQNQLENDANLEARNMRIFKLMNSSPGFTAK